MFVWPTAAACAKIFANSLYLLARQGGMRGWRATTSGKIRRCPVCTQSSLYTAANEEALSASRAR